MLSWISRMAGLSLSPAAGTERGSGEGSRGAESWSWVMEVSECWFSEICSGSGSGCESPLCASSSTSTAGSSASKACFINRERDIWAVKGNVETAGPLGRVGLINKTLKASDVPGTINNKNWMVQCTWLLIQLWNCWVVLEDTKG